MDSIDRYDEICAPLREDVSAWAAETHWEMQGLPLMKNAWRKSYYSWFPNDDLAMTILGDLFTADEIAEEEEDEIAIMIDEMAMNEDEEDDELDLLIVNVTN